MVTGWVGYNVLIERNPYRMNLTRFFFDVFRFALMYSLLLWSFLAEKPDHYYVFLFGITGYHLLMTLWYLYEIQIVKTATHGAKDLVPHGVAFVIYLALALSYLSAVAGSMDVITKERYHNLIVTATMATIVTWSAGRLSSLLKRIKQESEVLVAQ
jgi:hypothetical protein